MGLPFCRRGRGRRTVHNTNLLEKWLYSIIYCGKNIQSIFMKFSRFVYLVKGYCCANFRNQQSILTLYFYIVDAGKKEKKRKKELRLGAGIIVNQELT